jgi:hypothetical protein
LLCLLFCAVFLRRALSQVTEEETRGN